MKAVGWCIGLVLSGVVTHVASQDAYPNRPVRIVVTTTPGGANDITARVLAQAAQDELGQPVIVENKPGASGVIGANFVAKAAPDGYTLRLGTGATQVIAPTMRKDAGYDPVLDFTPIAFVGRAPVVLMVGPSLPVNTLAELINAAKKRPGEVSWATTGPAATYELSALMLGAIAGVNFNRIPYKGYPQMVNDVIGGVVDITVEAADASTLSPKLRTLAVLGARRIASRPNVSSAAELGYPEFSVPVWQGVFAPAKTPGPVVTKLTTAMRNAMARQDVKERISLGGVMVEGSDDATLAKMVRDDLVTVRELMRKAHVEPE